jgi:hypothetical protein
MEEWNGLKGPNFDVSGSNDDDNNDSCHIRGGLINLWLYKENKLQD